MPSSAACGPVSIRFWFSAFSTITVTAGQRRPGWAVATLRPTPEPGRETSPGSQFHRRSGVHRPVGAVQGHLQAAAEGQAVDECERRNRAVAEPTEHTVSEPSCIDRLLPVGHQRHALEVGAGGEDERLAGDADGDDARLGVGRGDRRDRARPALAGPSVFGLVWSCPLSRVISAALPAPKWKLDEPDQGSGDDLSREVVGSVVIRRPPRCRSARAVGSPRRPCRPFRSRRTSW